MDVELVVCYITAPTVENAQKIAGILIENHMAACVNLVGPIQSVYRWQGTISQDAEVLLMVKTRKTLVRAITAILKENHPYEVPELIAVPIVAGSSPYLDWVAQNTEE